MAGAGLDPAARGWGGVVDRLPSTKRSTIARATKPTARALAAPRRSLAKAIVWTADLTGIGEYADISDLRLAM
jgi:hypothetical protein